MDNQACVALLNYGETRCPILAACLREICHFLAGYNIELRAEYIASKDNCLAVLCSRAFSSAAHHRNFSVLLHNHTLKLECINYNLFNFQLDI